MVQMMVDSWVARLVLQLVAWTVAYLANLMAAQLACCWADWTVFVWAAPWVDKSEHLTVVQRD